MKYALLIYSEPQLDQPSPEELQEVMEKWNSYTEELRSAGVMLGGEALEAVETATSVMLRDGSVTTTDGPFAETKEVLGGFYLIETDTLDDALAWAAKCPGAAYGTIEVRPIWEVPES